jgi:hypothetical protein
VSARARFDACHSQPSPLSYAQAAVDRALQEFPLELRGVKREEIGLFANTENQLQSRIGASDAVWRFVVQRLGQSGSLYVRIVQKSTPPPEYGEMHRSDGGPAPVGDNEKGLSGKGVKQRLSRMFRHGAS